MVLQGRQEPDERVGEAGQEVRRELLEDAEVDEHPDDRLARPVVRAAQDARLEDPEVGGRLGSRRVGTGRGGSGRGGSSRGHRGPRRVWSRPRVVSLVWDQLDAASPPASAEIRSGDATLRPEVEPVARRQRVQDDVAHQDRPVATDLPGVGLGGGAVDDRDAAPADDLHDVVRPDDTGRVLVHAKAEEARVLGDEAEQAPEPVPLLEVLVDDDARQQPRPAAIWAIRCLGVAPDAPNAIMWLLSADAPADVPATTAPCGTGRGSHRPGAVPPIVELSRSWLPPVRKMPVASRDLGDGRLVVGLLARDCVERADTGRAELGEDLPIPCAGLRSERGRRADDDDRGVGSAGERDEPAEDDPVADLVLGAADDDDGPVRHR